MTGQADNDPFMIFRAWLAEAESSEPNDSNAMCLATADESGRPHARMVLLKGLDARGFVFYTNTGSAKGAELAANPRAALLFHWKSLGRQVRAEGDVEGVSAHEADAYFATRPRGSQIGAWASLQSRPLDARETLEARIDEYDRKYAGLDVPRPSHWSGYRVVPVRIEFWQAEEFRLHRRTLFTRSDGGWRRDMLYP